MKLFKFGLASIIASTALFAGTYNVDKAHSSVNFKVKHMMVSNTKGSFDDFKGVFEYDEKTNTLKSLKGEIKVSSINTANEKRDNHLRADDIFSASKYPSITFVLDKIEGGKAYGDLTLRGVTRPVALDFENGGSIKDPWGNQRAGFALSGKINRYDYGLKYNSVLEAGGLSIGEIVKLDIEIEGIKTK